MTDDFQLFPDAGGGGSGIDADTALITAYIARELSLVQIVAVEDRLATDAVFRERSRPIIATWVMSGSFGGHAVGTFARAAETDRDALLTRAEIEAGWQRYVARPEPVRADARPAALIPGNESAPQTRRTPMTRLAATIALVALPMLGFAQAIVFVAGHPDAPGHALAARLAAPFTHRPSPAMSHAAPGARSALTTIGDDPSGRSLRDDRDSAGIIIVENRAPDRTVRAFRLSDTPVFRIAADPAAGDTTLIATSLVHLSDGRFVVNDALARTLRFYSPTGRLLTIVPAAAPTGPLTTGYIRAISRVRGDSILVTRGVDETPILFNDRGQPVRLPFPAGESLGLQDSFGGGTVPTILGTFGDGTFVVEGVHESQSLPSTWKPIRDSLDSRRTAPLFRLNAAGARVINTIGVFPDLGGDLGVSYLYQGAGIGGAPSPQWGTVFPPTLRKPSAAIDSDRVLVAEGTTYEIRAYSPSGVLRRIIRAALAPPPFTPNDLERMKADAVMKLTGDARASALQSLSSLRFPATQAAFGRVLVDDVHRLWVQATVRPGDSAYWAVFDRDGRLMGTVTIPGTYRVVWIGETMIGLQRQIGPGHATEVVVYRLLRER
jgi:hypothetical protein